MLPWVVEKFRFDKNWRVDHANKIVRPDVSSKSLSYQNTIMAETLTKARDEEIFRVLKGWRNELYPIYGSRNTEVNVERAGSALFGIVSFGVHMTAYVKHQDGLKIWVPRRTRDKQTYGGMLDNTVAGGISTGEAPLECLIREATEEASFPEQLVRKHAKACGTVTYSHIRNEKAGGETGLLQPECQYVYDLEMDADIIPKPGDNEVEVFMLWTVKEVHESLAEGKFKPNCALVLLDFFVRHGILTAENEKDYVEIVSRLHRKLPFPTRSCILR